MRAGSRSSRCCCGGPGRVRWCTKYACGARHAPGRFGPDFQRREEDRDEGGSRCEHLAGCRHLPTGAWTRRPPAAGLSPATTAPERILLAVPSTSSTARCVGHATGPRRDPGGARDAVAEGIAQGAAAQVPVPPAPDMEGREGEDSLIRCRCWSSSSSRSRAGSKCQPEYVVPESLGVRQCAHPGFSPSLPVPSRVSWSSCSSVPGIGFQNASGWPVHAHGGAVL